MGSVVIRWSCLDVPMRAGSEICFFRPCAPNAPSMTLEAPYRQPIVQKAGIVNCFCGGDGEMRWGEMVD